MKAVVFLAGVALVLATSTGCGGGQQGAGSLETRPLEEARALEIAAEMLGERGFQIEKNVEVKLANETAFACDYRASEESIALEYMTEQDRESMGPVPPAAPGSRLHVIPARAASEDPGEQGESLYVFVLDDRKYLYQYNPTSENRADVTFLEVDSRLRRDLADFLSWYETNQVEQE